MKRFFVMLEGQSGSIEIVPFTDEEIQEQMREEGFKPYEESSFLDSQLSTSNNSWMEIHNDEENRDMLKKALEDMEDSK